MANVPTLTDIEREARALIAEHVPGVPFQWDNAKRRAGACHFRRSLGQTTIQKITLSRPIFDHSDEAKLAARDVILHEIAHAIAGHAAGHGPAWRAHARRLGCTSTRCHSLPVPESGILRWCSDGCEGNGINSGRTRLPKRLDGWRCRACGATVRWQQEARANRQLVAASNPVPADVVARRKEAGRKAAATRKANAARKARGY